MSCGGGHLFYNEGNLSDFETRRNMIHDIGGMIYGDYR